MFEAKPPRAAEGFPLHDEPVGGEALRELTWAELVARLSASRAARGAFGQSDDAWAASFDASHAPQIAAHHHGELAVNLDDSIHGKDPPGIAPAAMNGIGTGFVPGVARK